MADIGLQLNGGFLQSIPGTADTQQVIQVVNNIIDTLNNQLQTTIYADGTSKRYLSGYQVNGWPGGNFGMKISVAGVDVTTATTSQLLFSWDFTTGTQYWYDQTTHKNYMQEGTLPDGTGGLAVAAPGFNVSDIYS